MWGWEDVSRLLCTQKTILLEIINCIAIPKSPPQGSGSLTVGFALYYARKFDMKNRWGRAALVHCSSILVTACAKRNSENNVLCLFCNEHVLLVPQYLLVNLKISAGAVFCSRFHRLM